MSVHQTNDLRWFVRYPKGKNKEDPNRTREYFGRGPDAERSARERNYELGLGIKKKDTSPFFTEIANAYLAAKGPAMARVNLANLTTKLQNIILPEFIDTRAAAITPEILDQFVATRLQTVKRTSVHRDLSDIRAILRWAVKRRYVTVNPMEGFDFPRRDDAVIEPPSAAEIQAILRHASPHLYRAIILAYYTGCRPGVVELYRLTWQDIDLVSGNITIRSADKGGLKKRVVPIMDKEFSELLNLWLDDDLASKKTPADPVVTYKGKPVKILKTAWQAAKRRAKITRRIRMYDIRHAFATKLLDNGADLKHVSNLLGHKSIQQTVDTYQHLSKSLTKETMQKLPSIL